MKKVIANIQYIIILVLIFPIVILSCNQIKADSNTENIDYSAVPGIIKIWAGSSAPTGYLLCDGREVSRTTYADLFNEIGTTYGDGNGSTTFNLPNTKGRVIVGIDKNETMFDTLGKKGGEKTVTLTTSSIPSHSHTFTGISHSHTFTGTSVTLASSGAHTHTLNNHTHVVPARGGYLYPNGNHAHHMIRSNGVGLYSSGDEEGGYKLSQSGGYQDRVIVDNSGTSSSTNLTTGNQSSNHVHTVTLPAATSGSANGTTGGINANHTHSVTIAGKNSSVTVGGTINNTGSSETHNNLQPYITQNYIIKY